MLLAGCAYPLGGDRPAPPARERWTCRPAPEQAIAAVDALIPQQGALVAAQMVRVTSPDGGYRNYPNFVLAARFATLTDESEVGVWAMSSAANYAPVYPINLAAMRLTAPNAGADSEFLAEVAPMAEGPAALAVRDCAAGVG